MNKVIVLTPHFWPAKKAGGPVKSVGAIVRLLSKHADVDVLTKANDVGSSSAMEGVAPNCWVKAPGCNVFYSSGLLSLLRQIFFAGKKARVNEVTFYLNSFFAFEHSILFFLMRWFGAVSKNSEVILAPRGEFSEGALALKKAKKDIFIVLSKFLGIHKGVIWHATSDEEVRDIKRVWGGAINIKMAPNMVDEKIGEAGGSVGKELGCVKVFFLSRISPKKNLEYALDFLKKSKSKVVFDIYGPKEDAIYWSRCEKVMNELQSNVEVRYQGVVDVDDVPSVISQYHLFVLPTMGENFGHAIAESLQCGCPVLISDQTPWRKLEEQGVGWDLALDNPEAFARAVDVMAEMGEESFNEMRMRVKAFIAERLKASDASTATLRMFNMLN